MILQFFVGLVLVAGLAVSVRRASARHDMNFQLVILWFTGVALLAAGLVVLLRQDLLIETIGISTSAAATVAIGVLLTAIAFRLSKIQGSTERMARETAINVASLQIDQLPPEARPRSPREPLIVIPAFNEAETIGPVIGKLNSLKLRCVVVNDGSSDRTSQVARNAGAWVIDLPTNLGIGAALRVGWVAADRLGYESAVQCDADGQHDPDQIPALVQRAQTDEVHLMIGSRFAGEHGDEQYEASLIRRSAMRILSSHASRVAGVRLTDATSGFRCISQPLLHEFSRAYPIQYMESYESLILSSRAGWTAAELPARMGQRLGGKPSHGPLASMVFMFRALSVRAIGSSIAIAQRPN